MMGIDCESYTHPKMNMSPTKEPFQKEKSSSNQHFGGDVVSFLGSNIYIYIDIIRMYNHMWRLSKITRATSNENRLDGPPPNKKMKPPVN